MMSPCHGDIRHQYYPTFLSSTTTTTTTTTKCVTPRRRMMTTSTSTLTSSTMTGRRRRKRTLNSFASCIVVIFVVSVAVYWNSMECGFVFDDVTAVKDNRDLRPHVPVWNLFRNDFWGTPMDKERSHKSYRPITVLSFRINYLIHGLDPSGFHAVNVLLHGIVSVLYFVTLTSLFPGIEIDVAFLSGILFAVHPIHSEAVTGVVGRAELLSSMFYLLAILVHRRGYQHKRHYSHGTSFYHVMGTLALTTLATLSKEQGITVIGILVVYESLMTCSFLFSKRIGILLTGTAVLLAIRMKIMGGQLPVFTKFDNPAAASVTPTRQLTFNYLCSLNFWLLLNPCDLCCDWTMNTVPLVTSIFDLRNLATVSLYAAILSLVIVSFRTKRDKKFKFLLIVGRDNVMVIMAMVMTIVPFIPASNLFFHVGFVIAERILYLPSMGFCFLVSLGWNRVKASLSSSSSSFLWNAGLVILILVHGFKTHSRNFDWKDEYSIFTSGLKVAGGNNAKLYNNVGHALEASGDHDTALKYFRAAVQVEPDDIGAHINVGRAFNHMNKYREAEEAYLKAKALLPQSKPGQVYHARVAPNHLRVFLNLATLISRNLSRLEEADSLYRQAISMRADYTEAYINRGDVLIKLNRTNEAKEVYEAALRFEKDNPDLYYNLGVVFLELGQPTRALQYLDKALEFDPDHFQALLNSAILIQESGSSHLRQTAFDRLMKIVQGGRPNERVYFNLGMLSMDKQDYVAAERWFRKSVELKPDFRSALFNLALLLSESDRPMDGAPFLHQLIHYHPDHIKGLILLGDFYVNHLRDLKSAENCYRRILRLDPQNVQGLHNLCVVMVEAGDLNQARSCLREARRLAPNEEYISRHLSIVEERLKQKLKQ